MNSNENNMHMYKDRIQDIYKELNKKLIIGSSLFGAGWGLAGLCPGPAIASLALLNLNSVGFVIFMFIGFYLVKLSDLTTQAR